MATTQEHNLAKVGEAGIHATGRVGAAQGQAPAHQRDTIRLTADVPAKDAATLSEVARETGFNKVTTLVRAIRVLAELVRAESEGGELTIKYPNGTRERLIIR